MYTVPEIYVPDVEIVQTDKGMDDPEHLKTLLGGVIFPEDNEDKFQDILLERIIR